MKKLILLLVLPLTALMSIDFTMTQEGLFTEATTQPPTSGTTPEASNPYLEPVNLPKCDANNPEVQLIRSNSDWSTINSNKRIFCVSPGNYTSLKNLKITASGTAKKRRYIILNNGNDTHPGKLNKSQLANFSLSFTGASYWTLDRPCSFDNGLSNAYQFKLGSTNNIINRMYTNNIARSVQIRDNAHNNTVQNSRIDTMTHNARLGDKTAIEIVPYAVGGKYECIGTKIINNEIVNVGDGFQMVSFWYKDAAELNGEGTIVDSNDIYFTSDIYTDGRGNYDPAGSFMYAENSLDFKFGSLNPNNPVIISNNNLWGVRKADRTNSSLSTAGSVITAHFGAFNINFINNRIFDANMGIGIGSKESYTHAYSGEISGNIFQDCGTIGGIAGMAFSIGSAKDTLTENNIISNSRGSHLRAQNNVGNNILRNNIALDTPEDWYLSANASSGSTYAYEPANDNGSSYQEVKAVSQGYTEDYVFTTDNFTNSPRVIILENVMKPN